MVVEYLNEIIWGILVLVLILTIGIFFSVRTKFIQIQLFPHACSVFFDNLRNKKSKTQGISGYRALCTALAATVGTGNIVGVAGAIAIGGPGVVFWMWICALLGMVIKLAEISLAIKYREKDPAGNWVGGPMYTIKNALSEKYHYLALIYAFSGVVASFGIGNATQVNAVMGGIQKIASYHHYSINYFQCMVIGTILGTLLLLAFRHGASGIGNWAQKLVPFASIVYILIALVYITMQIDKIPEVISNIIIGAFSPKTVTCGMVSSAFICIRVGTSRGIFTNEAGMGTASIAHAGADVSNPISQGLLGCVEVFLDTIVMCTLTAFVVLANDIPKPYGTDPGINLTLGVFTDRLGIWSAYLIVILMCIFAFATVLGWGLYGLRCAEFLFGPNARNRFLTLQFIATIMGTMVDTANIWQFSELVNGVMAIPNLICLCLLFPIFRQQIFAYKK